MASTIADVAARAGVSTATVSRALRGLAGVSDAARARVLSAAQELGYVVSPSAQALATGRTMSVAMVVASFSEWFGAHALDGAQRRLQRAGYTTVVHSVENVRGKPHVDFDLVPLRRRVDGLLIIGIPLNSIETAAIADLGIPVIVVGNRNPPFPSVGLDDVEAGVMATRYLLSLGHAVIGHISGSAQEVTPLTPGGGRLEGWRLALERAGLEHGDDLFVQSFFDVSGGRDAMLELIDRRPDITGVFAAADCIAYGAIQALEERGLAVPDDVSVVGVDGENGLGASTLTTVVQHPDDQGRSAADMLLRMINGGAVSDVTAVHGMLRPGRTTTAHRTRFRVRPASPGDVIRS